MANNTDIAWTDVTVNPFPGCRKVSPGCANCYAERMARRLKAMGQPAYRDVVDEHGWTGKVRTHRGMELMRVPGKGKMVFVQSMGDLFYEGIPPIGVSWIFYEILHQPQHIWQILTKRPDKALAYYRERPRISQEHDGWPDPTMAPNIWLGVTAENQEWTDERIPVLLQIPAAVRFVSFEPLLGPIDLLPWFADVRCSNCGWLGYRDADDTEGGLARKYDGPADEEGHWECPRCGASEDGCVHDYSPLHNPFGPDPRIDWLIVGCESGPQRRPCDTRWVLDIIEQCRSAGIPVFVKQISMYGKVVHEAERIATHLGYKVEDIRQWPRKETDRAIPNKRL